MIDYTVSATGNCRVEFFNDNSTSRDVQVDYLSVGGQIRQAKTRVPILPMLYYICAQVCIITSCVF